MDRRPAWRIWIRRLAPWVITIGVVAFLLHEYSLSEIVAELKHGSALPLIPLSIVMVLTSLLAVSTADFIVLRGLLGGPRFFDVVRGKAASSLLDIVGYALGHGGYAVWIARRAGTDAMTAGGILLYIMASDLTAVLTVATAAVWIGGAPAGGFVRVAAPLIVALLVTFKIIGPLKLLGDRSPRIFHPWNDLPRRRAFAQLGVRIAQICFFVLVTWLATRLFGMPIPLSAMATYLPVILLVGSLPINVAGFGAVQAAWLLLDEHASGAQLLAFHFLWHLMNMIAITLRGLPFVRRLVVEVDEGRRAAEASAEAADESSADPAAERAAAPSDS